MPQEIDIDRMFKAIMAHPLLVQVPEAAHPAFREIVDPLPEEIAKVLDVQVTAGVLACLRAGVARRMIDTHFPYKLYEALPPEQRGSGRTFPSPESLEDGLKGARKGYVEMAMLGPVWLAQRGLNDRSALSHPKLGGFGAEAMKAYDAGELTVRKLLEIEPFAIVRGNV